MSASISPPRTRAPGWSRVVVWLAVFFSPTLYFLLLLLAGSLRLNLPGAGAVVVALFLMIPVAALLYCERAVWSSGQTDGRRFWGMLLTLLAMLLQLGALFVVLYAILVTAISLV